MRKKLFQSTLPCGSDPVRRYYNLHRRYFNPRSLAGATSYEYLKAQGVAISIHAPLRERRGNMVTNNMWVLISIHAPLRERPAKAMDQLGMSIFQSTLPCGSDRINSPLHYLPMAFQSTLPCGSDLGTQGFRQIMTISIHAPLRERLLTEKTV